MLSQMTLRNRRSLPCLIRHLEEVAIFLEKAGHTKEAKHVRMSIEEHNRQLIDRTAREDIIESMEVDDVHGDEWM